MSLCVLRHIGANCEDYDGAASATALCQPSQPDYKLSQACLCMTGLQFVEVCTCICRLECTGAQSFVYVNSYSSCLHTRTHTHTHIYTHFSYATDTMWPLRVKVMDVLLKQLEQPDCRAAGIQSKPDTSRGILFEYVITSLPFFKMVPPPRFEMLHPRAEGVGCKTRLESRTNKIKNPISLRDFILKGD